MRVWWVCLWLACLVSLHAAAETSSNSVSSFIERAEEQFYRFDQTDRLSKVTNLLNQMEEISPNHPYLHWARARISFWEKEGLYLSERNDPKKDFQTIKLNLGKECHVHADACIQADSQNAECYLIKSACYAMQASTWGQTLKTLRVLRPMMLTLEKAKELPSTFLHMGSITTNQLATIMQGALYRIMPDSFWFWIFARVQGNKLKSQALMKKAVTGKLLREPMMVIELASSLICYGLNDKKEAALQEGLKVLEEGLKLPIRNSMDELDFQNMRFLVRHPEESCNYRRERFEKISQQSMDQAVKPSATNR